MKMSQYENKMAENEMLFRRANEGVAKGVASVKSIAREHSQQDVLGDIDEVVLNFWCECKSEKCQRRIPMSIGEFERRHKNERQFVVLAGHQDSRIERVVLEMREYLVVEQFGPMPSGPTSLNRV